MSWRWCHVKLSPTPKDLTEQPEAFPHEIWELIELVLASCPDLALKTFRKSLIGKGKPLTAKMADAAINGARATLRTGPLIGSRGRTKRAEVPESLNHSLARMHWYMRRNMTAVFARAQDHQWHERELELIKVAQEFERPLTFLEWHEVECSCLLNEKGKPLGDCQCAGVDRVAGPSINSPHEPELPGGVPG